mmetsp:Transcript_14431/g.36975  ORF Transcript_14431/g.36975 Transcript_14431/m.36975 type:complete len:215 (+) Transcript_14431:430-1074(+)
MTSMVACCTWAARARSSPSAAPRRKPSSTLARSIPRSCSKLQPLPGRMSSMAEARNVRSACAAASIWTLLPVTLLLTCSRSMAACRRNSPCNAPSIACSSSGAALPALLQAFMTISCALSPNLGTMWPASTCACSELIWANASMRLAPALPSANASPWKELQATHKAAAASSTSLADLLVPLRSWHCAGMAPNTQNEALPAIAPPRGAELRLSH